MLKKQLSDHPFFFFLKSLAIKFPSKYKTNRKKLRKAVKLRWWCLKSLKSEAVNCSHLQIETWCLTTGMKPHFLRNNQKNLLYLKHALSPFTFLINSSAPKGRKSDRVQQDIRPRSVRPAPRSELTAHLLPSRSSSFSFSCRLSRELRELSTLDFDPRLIVFK